MPAFPPLDPAMLQFPSLRPLAASTVALAAAGLAFAYVAQSPGYDDTPFLPGGEWRVHDSRRPQPRVVGAPAGQAPSDAVVLFDGTDLSKWKGRDGGAQWKVEIVRDFREGFVAINSKSHNLLLFG